MPTITRSVQDIARLSPFANGMSFAGSDGRSTNFTVDGANFNNNFGLSSNLPGGGNPISLDAIEEVQVVVAPFDVRQTNFIGGGINAITKSGTNEFKGTAYTYYKNQEMRGNRIDEIDFGIRNIESTKTYGISLGGPIIKNKLFFFVNGEYELKPGQVVNWRPSEDGVANTDLMLSRTSKSDMEKVKQHLLTNYGYDPGSYTDYPADESNKSLWLVLTGILTTQTNLASGITLLKSSLVPNKRQLNRRRLSLKRIKPYFAVFNGFLQLNLFAGKYCKLPRPRLKQPFFK